MRIGLVGCVKSKRAEPAAAMDLYTSNLFVGRRRWVERSCDRWYVLSALHGLLDPETQIEPYDVALKDAGRPERRAWSRRVLGQLRDELGGLEGHTFELHAGSDYLDYGIAAGLMAAGATVDRPFEGLSLGEQLSVYASVPPAAAPAASVVVGPDADGTAKPTTLRDVPRQEVLGRFYAGLDELSHRLAGPRLLSECTGRTGWPTAGVYFFFEDGQERESGGHRVVRVGTHALTATSGTSLWSRLRAHRGTRHGGGNHRGSIFRLHVGTALLNRGLHPEAAKTWGSRSAPREVRDNEKGLEQAVSDHIGRMPFLWVRVDDRLARDRIERGAIALLSNYERTPIDPPSKQWLGRDADRDLVRSAGLWNVNHTTDAWNGDWLAEFESWIQRTSTG